MRPVAAAAFGGSALESLFAETVSLFHRLQLVARQVHKRGELTAGKRGVLMSLHRLGPQTVPQMARARPVSRQYIQTLVNLLAGEGHVDFIENPAHKRSALVGLTPRGEAFVEAMSERERKIVGRLRIGVAEEELWRGAAVLRAVREAFEGERWRRALRASR